VVASSDSRSAKSTECGRSLLDVAADFLAAGFLAAGFLAARFADDFLTDLRGDLRADFFALDLPDFLDELERVDALAMVCYRVRVSAEK